MESVLGKVYDELKTTLGVEYALIRNAPDELEKLKRLRMVISNVQLDAVSQDSSHQQALSDWLNEMKDAAYDAEDIIDMFNTEILRRRSKNDNNGTTRLFYRVNDFFSHTTNPLLLRHRIGSSVQKTFYRLADIAKEREYHFTLSGRDRVVENLRMNMLDTFSYMGKDDFFGREQDLEIIIDRLFKVKTNIEVLVLVGMGVLEAKKVYNDDRVNALFGKKKLWVCVSETFNLPKNLKLVIQQITRKPCQLEGMQALTMELIELFKGNMYLLILDDVWTDASLTRDCWSKMKSLFHNCKIMHHVMSESYMHHVGILPEDVCCSLFENYVFPNGIVRDDLKEIGKKMVKKCKGVPLALRVLGSMMHTNQDYSYWLPLRTTIF